MAREAIRSGTVEDREKPKKGRLRLSPLAMIMPVAVCLLIGAFTYQIARRSGYPAGLAAGVSVIIGLLWFGFLLGRLLDRRK